MPDDHADTVVQIPFAVHDVDALQSLARALWTASNGSVDGIDQALGAVGNPDLQACIREVLGGVNLGITISLA